MKLPAKTTTTLVGLTASASAALTIYEPFAYADTGPINDGAYLGRW